MLGDRENLGLPRNFFSNKEKGFASGCGDESEYYTIREGDSEFLRGVEGGTEGKGFGRLGGIVGKMNFESECGGGMASLKKMERL